MARWCSVPLEKHLRLKFSSPAAAVDLFLHSPVLPESRSSHSLSSEVSLLLSSLMFKAFSARQLKMVVNDSPVAENMHSLVS